MNETESDYRLYVFYKCIYEVVDDSSVDSVVSWSEDKKSFIIWDPMEFQTRILPTTERRGRLLSPNFSMFIADLKYYGFVKVKGSKHRFHFGHPKYFVRGKPAAFEKVANEKRTRIFLRDMAMRKKARARAMELADALGDLAL